MIGLRPRGSFSDYLSLMLGKPRIRLNNLKNSLRFPCLGLNPIIDSIILITKPLSIFFMSSIPAVVILFSLPFVVFWSEGVGVGYFSIF